MSIGCMITLCLILGVDSLNSCIIPEAKREIKDLQGKISSRDNNFPESQSQFCSFNFVSLEENEVVVVKILQLNLSKQESCKNSTCISHEQGLCHNHLTLQDGTANTKVYICGNVPPKQCFVLKSNSTRVISEARIQRVCSGPIQYVDKQLTGDNNVYLYLAPRKRSREFSFKFDVVNVTEIVTVATTRPATTTESIQVSTLMKQINLITESPTGQTNTTTTTAPTQDSNNLGPIVGGTVGGIALLVVVMVTIIVCWKKKRIEKTETNRNIQKPPSTLQDRSGGQVVENILYTSTEEIQNVPRANSGPSNGNRKSEGVTDVYASVPIDPHKKKEKEMVVNVLYGHVETNE